VRLAILAAVLKKVARQK